MQFYGGDLEDQVTSSTLVVCLVSLIMICVPFTLSTAKFANSSSMLYISLPPTGNQTVANDAILYGYRPELVVFQLDNYTWAHFICILAGIEILLLWSNLSKIGNNIQFTQENVVKIGGLYTANNEFWVYVGSHHVIIFILLLSPLSFHALLLFAWVVVTTISKLCEPREEQNDDDHRSETYYNHVIVLFGCIFISCALFVVDGRMTQKSIDYLPKSHIDLLFVQFLIDSLLVVSHVSGHSDLDKCYYFRLTYTFACWLMVIIFLASG
jgi:hypothetical protein